MNPTFKYIYHKTLFGRLLIFIYHESKNRFWSDRLVIKHNYFRSTGKKLNLKNPQTLNEKINWLKLYDRRPIQTICADKFEVRKYIKEKIGEQYLVPLIFHTENPKDINETNLPKYPCAIKTNHDSGGVTLVYDKHKLDFNKIQSSLEHRLKSNFYETTREWQYKDIFPQIIVEKLLLNDLGKIPLDYKIHCINGKAHMIQVDIDRDTKNHYRNWYYSNWTRCPFKWTSSKDGIPTNPSNFDVPPPKSLEKMIELSNVLSEPFDYVRVDWYDVDGKLYFGEITFHHDSGCRLIEPEEWDYKLGKMVILNKNHK